MIESPLGRQRLRPLHAMPGTSGQPLGYSYKYAAWKNYRKPIRSRKNPVTLNSVLPSHRSPVTAAILPLERESQRNNRRPAHFHAKRQNCEMVNNDAPEFPDLPGMYVAEAGRGHPTVLQTSLASAFSGLPRAYHVGLLVQRLIGKTETRV